MKRVLFIFIVVLLAWPGSQAMAQEVDDSLIEGVVSNDPCTLGFCDREWLPQVGMAARRSSPTTRYRSADGTASYNCNNTVAGGERIVRYPFAVADSRTMEWVRVWGRKGVDTADLFLSVHRSCMSQTQVTPTTATLAQTTVSTTGGEFSSFMFLDNEVPVNLDCKYWLEVRFGDSGTACAANHTNMRIYKMRVQSRLPDPLFSDRFSL